jgi:hypothetical protein
MAKDKAYKQAEQKIAEALKTGATELDLIYLNSTGFFGGNCDH